MDGAARNTHRIRRLTFAFGATDEAAMLVLRQRVAAMSDALEAAVAPVLDTHAGADEVIAIDRLEVSLDPAQLQAGAALDPGTLAAALDRALGRALRRARSSAAPRDPARATAVARGHGTTPAERLAEALAVFLRSGTLPWWAPGDRLEGIERALAGLSDIAISAIARRLAPVLMEEGAALRLAIQLAPEQARRIAAALPRARNLPALQDWRVATRGPPGRSGPRDTLAAQVRRAARADPGAAPLDNDGDESADIARSEPREARAEKDPEQADGIAIRHAGVILAAPFLPAFFDRLDLLRERTFRDTAAAERAVALIGALAGDPSPAEPELALAKLLAGRRPDAAQPRDVGLGPFELAAVEALLSAMIGHWTALGQASPEGLRETFLRRPGRLEHGATQDRLEVERRGVDVLIDRLPWAVTPIRLPWMTRPLRVGWR